MHFYSQARKKTKKNLPEKKFLTFPEMELSSSNIKKNLYILSKESISYVPETEPCTFQLKP